MFECNFQFVLLLASLIGFSVSFLTALRDVSASGNQTRTFVLSGRTRLINKKDHVYSQG